MQRITGVDSKVRIIASVITSNVFCANSTNYISTNKNDESMYYLLGVINSKLINFYFKQTSTNTNVTSKEIAKFPIKISDLAIKRRIGDLSHQVYELKKNNSLSDTTSIEQEIDRLVYHLYGLTYDEVKIVDPENHITEEEYNKA